MRELMYGPKRFGDLRASLPGISANVLTQRLEGLEGHGVLKRRKLPPPASVQVYELTEWGRDIAPMIRALGKWAARSPKHDPGLPLSPVSMMMSLETMFDAVKAGDAAMTLGFRFGDEGFVVRVGEGVLTAERTDPDGSDVILTTYPEAVAGAVYGGAPLPADARVEGDAAVFERFTTFFELPPKAAVA